MISTSATRSHAVLESAAELNPKDVNASVPLPPNKSMNPRAAAAGSRLTARENTARSRCSRGPRLIDWTLAGLPSVGPCKETT